MNTTAAPIDRKLLEGSLADFRHSYTLPGEAYTSPELFAWEMRNFFETTWVCLGRSEGLMRPGSRRALRVGAESILLTRDDAGTLRGFFNICRHRGHELLPVGASAEGPHIQCPYHGWTYKQDGSLKSAPLLGLRPGFEVAEHRLTPVRVDEWEGWVFVNVSSDAPPLKQHLGNLAEDMAPWAPRDMVEVGRMDYLVKANWKLIHENYQECYHCSEIHPELCRVSPPKSGLNLAATGMWIGGWMDLEEGAETMSLTGKGGAPKLPGLSTELQHRVYYYALFPNLLVSPHPDFVLSHRVEPISPSETLVECRTLFPRAVAEREGFDGAYAGDFWDVTNRQDWAACESIQRSAASRGFKPGPISEMEESVYQFFNMVAEGYVDGHISPPKNPVVLAKPQR
ncbi:MAG TPA: aromatic ring-hydroxylating dioxygenase subunit alpha [Candidatus Dormibacteraeota bacterium]|nr:aromatic ring-hydroxylating dioxygenase subunit alpha [Candidatus Dormibacteraeota bacterium]